MIIVGENLKQLQKQHHICNSSKCFDDSCLQLSLGGTIVRLIRSANSEEAVLSYGDEIPKSFIVEEDISSNGLFLSPKSAVLACSAEKIRMPQGYMGLLQTKGSLARLFVSLHFSDGQIDPGFEGHVTFEIFNASDFTVHIKKQQMVGNLYIFKTSTKNTKKYDGRYANSDRPTIQVPEKFVQE